MDLYVQVLIFRQNDIHHTMNHEHSLGKHELFAAYRSKSCVVYVEQTIAVGSVRNTYRKECLSVGILLNNFGYVIDA